MKRRVATERGTEGQSNELVKEISQHYDTRGKETGVPFLRLKEQSHTRKGLERVFVGETISLFCQRTQRQVGDGDSQALGNTPTEQQHLRLLSPPPRKDHLQTCVT